MGSTLLTQESHRQPDAHNTQTVRRWLTWSDQLSSCICVLVEGSEQTKTCFLFHLFFFKITYTVVPIYHTARRAGRRRISEGPILGIPSTTLEQSWRTAATCELQEHPFRALNQDSWSWVLIDSGVASLFIGALATINGCKYDYIGLLFYLNWWLQSNC